VDGHTRKICERIATALQTQGHAVVLASLDDDAALSLALTGPEPVDQIVLGASIRYGHFRPELWDFIRTRRSWLDRLPSAFFCVNVVARKPGKAVPEANPYMRRFWQTTDWRPQPVAVFAGKIDYQRYRWRDRLMIRLIMWITHGPTDPKACVEFTDWAAVDAFAHQLARSVSPGAAA
jgi:menaquinone-dependent protoporphyrinogen oxidase